MNTNETFETIFGASFILPKSLRIKYRKKNLELEAKEKRSGEHIPDLSLIHKNDLSISYSEQNEKWVTIHYESQTEVLLVPQEEKQFYWDWVEEREKIKFKYTRVWK